jgi:hypothetical protein
MSKSTAEIKISSLSPIDDLMDRCERMMSQHWAENPDLYQIIQAKKQRPEESKGSPTVKVVLNLP